MKKRTIILSAVVLGLSSVFYSCQFGGNTRDFYTLTDHEDKPVELAVFETSKDTVITFKSGSTLEIPNNAFVKKDGSEAVGEIEIKFSEYHTLGEIYASGNPMLFKEADGRLGQMLSGGMLDFNAFDSNGDELMLKEDKPVKINLACQSGGDNFDLFYIEEQTIQADHAGLLQMTTAPINQESKLRWKREKKVTLSKRKNLETELATIVEPKQPIQPQANDTSKVFFNINMDFKKFPEFKGFSSLIFTFLESSDEEILNKKWSSIDLKDSGLGYFDMVLTSKKSSVTVPVVPMLDGDEFAKAFATFKENNTAYKLKLDKINRQKQAKLNAGAYLASFLAKRTGTFNIDAIYHQVESVRAFEPQFVYNNKPIDVKEMLLVSSFDGAKSVVNYNKSNLDEFFYIPMLRNSIMVTAKGGQVYAVNYKQFQKQSFGADNIKLELNKSPDVVLTLDDKSAYLYRLNNATM